MHAPPQALFGCACVVLGAHLARLARLDGSVGSASLSLELNTIAVRTADPDDVLTFEVESETVGSQARPPRVRAHWGRLVRAESHAPLPPPR